MTTSPQFTIRPSQPSDLPLLPAIRASALAIFETIEDIAYLASSTPPLDPEDIRPRHDAGLLWVAEVTPCAPTSDAPPGPSPRLAGYLAAKRIGDYMHGAELMAAREHQGSGVAALLGNAFRGYVEQKVAGGALGVRGMTLVTSKLTPWTWPWYERRGFRMVADDEVGPEHREIMKAQRRKWAGKFGESRVLMVLEFEGERVKGERLSSKL